MVAVVAGWPPWWLVAVWRGAWGSGLCSPAVVVAVEVGWGWSGSGGAADALQVSCPAMYFVAGCRGLWGKGVWMRTCWLGFTGGVTLWFLFGAHFVARPS